MTPENTPDDATDDARDNTLAYIDQASFLGLRALGHGPVIQFTWTYRHPVDPEGLRRFHRSLGRGLLGRRVERSPLPFGRHRWVAWPGLPDVEVAAPRQRGQVGAWADEQAALPLDPEYGPSWRLAVTPLTDGGSAVTLVVSHTVADGLGLAVAVAEAAGGVTRDLGYPPPRSRAGGPALREDARAFARRLPEIARAVRAAVRLARANRADFASSARRAPAGRGRRRGDRTRAVPVPSVPVASVTVHVDAARWDERAAALGGTATSLLLAFGVLLGERLGLADAAGSVHLAVPVSERTPGDTRGNALTRVTLSADPAAVAEDLGGLRAALREALRGLDTARQEMLAPLPLVPLLPRAVVRRLAGVVVESGVVACSNLGELDPAVNRPDGTDAESFAARLTERISAEHLQRVGAVLFPLGSGRVGGRVFITIGFAREESPVSAQWLAGAVRAVLTELGLAGAVG